MDDQHAEPGAGPIREPWPAREAESSADRQQARVTWRELLAVALMVVLALLADRHDEAERLATRRDREGWTSYQVVDQLLLQQLRAHQTHWAEYSDLSKRQQTRARFDQYAYQWF